jgi:hypothetical protein
MSTITNERADECDTDTTTPPAMNLISKRHEISTLSVISKRKRSNQSDIWKYFLNHPEDNEKVVCRLCLPTDQTHVNESVLRIFSSNTSTTPLKKHLNNCHRIFLNCEESPSKQRKIDETFACALYQKKACDHFLFTWLTQRHLPYSTVNHQEMKQFVRNLHPGYKMASVETLKDILYIECAKVKEHIMSNVLPNLVGGSLSADGWTSGSGDSYFGILLHSMDEDGKEQVILLDAMPKNDSQTAVVLAKRVRDVMISWGLEDEVTKPLSERKIKHFTSDTTPTMPLMVAELGFHWIPCIGHMFNLVVSDALNLPSSKAVLKKCRKMITNLNKSAPVKNALKVAQANSSLPIKALPTDVKTRWNSTFEMMNAVVENKVALLWLFPILPENISAPKTIIERKKRKRQMTEKQWTALKEFSIILLPFKQATKAFESNQKPTLSLTVPIVHWLHGELMGLPSNFSHVSTELIEKLLDGIETRFLKVINNTPDYWTSLFFDPRTKDFLKGRENQEGQYQSLIERAKNLVGSLMTPSSSIPIVAVEHQPSFLDQILQTRIPSVEEESKFDLYLRAPSCQTTENIKDWFVKHNVLEIFLLHRRYCCVPGAATRVERLWSEAGYLISRRRCRLLPTLVNFRLQWKTNARLLPLRPTLAIDH